MEWKEKIKVRFSKSADADKWSNIYTSNTPNVDALSFRKRRDFTVDYVIANIQENSDILDLGCGAGPVLTVLKEHSYKLIGIDYSLDMLQHARRELGNNIDQLPLLRAECEKVPMRDSTFDCIICLGVISYAESIDTALGEIYRLLKPGGKVIVSYRNKYNDILLDPIQLIKYIFSLPFTLHRPEKKEIGRSIPRSEVLGFIRNHPFEVITEHQIGFGKIKLNGKTISDGKTAIKFNEVLGKTLRFLRMNFLYRAIADVHIFVLAKRA